MPPIFRCQSSSWAWVTPTSPPWRSLTATPSDSPTTPARRLPATSCSSCPSRDSWSEGWTRRCPGSTWPRRFWLRSPSSSPPSWRPTVSCRGRRGCSLSRGSHRWWIRKISRPSCFRPWHRSHPIIVSTHTIKKKNKNSSWARHVNNIL